MEGKHTSVSQCPVCDCDCKCILEDMGQYRNTVKLPPNTLLVPLHLESRAVICVTFKNLIIFLL